MIDAIERQQLVTRDCYYRKLGASQELIDWLKTGDCESVYCREVEQEFIAGPKGVPRVCDSVCRGPERVWRRRDGAQMGNDKSRSKYSRWILRRPARRDFNLLKQTPRSRVLSVMTDRNGTAYFTDLGPGTYVLTNMIPTELGQTVVSWNCEVQVKKGDLATEKPTSSRTGKTVSLSVWAWRNRFPRVSKHG